MLANVAPTNWFTNANINFVKVGPYSKTIWCQTQKTPDVSLASKHDTLTQCWFNVGPPSTTSDNIEPTLGQQVVFAGRCLFISLTAK